MLATSPAFKQNATAALANLDFLPGDLGGERGAGRPRALVRHGGRGAGGPGFMPRNVMLVTGPSRSADIESTLELGAHGPRRVHVILVDDDPAALA